MKIIKHWISLVALVGCMLNAAAQNSSPPEGPPPGPPPEAVAACKGKAEGTKVEFAGRHGDTVSGICRKQGDVIAAMPEGGPPPRR